MHYFDEMLHQTPPPSGCLFIVATPIGNLEDISARALKTLREVDFIAAEDTRHSQALLQHFGIKTPLLAAHQYNEKKMVDKIIGLLSEGKNVALVSDAGTPLISDPGYHLINAAQAAHVKVVPIPGPCAAITALSVAGLPTDQFLFVGFLPPKSTARQNKLAELKAYPFTLIFYEAPHRVLAMLEDLKLILGPQRSAAMGRELTKKFETIVHAPLVELERYVQQKSDELCGEFVILVEGAEENPTDKAEGEKILKILLADLPLTQAVKLASKITQISRNEIYRLALLLTNSS